MLGIGRRGPLGRMEAEAAEGATGVRGAVEGALEVAPGAGGMAGGMAGGTASVSNQKESVFSVFRQTQHKRW